MKDEIEIKTFEDVINNLDTLINKEIYYSISGWHLKDYEIILDESLFDALFLCGLIDQELTFVSNYPLLLYTLNPILFKLNLNKFRKQLFKLVLLFKENNRRFKSYKDVENILNNANFSTFFGETFNNKSYLWTEYKYDKSFIIKSNEYPYFKYEHVYNGIPEGIKNKGVLYHTVLRLVNNLFYKFDYPLRGWNSKYMEEIEGSNGKIFNKKLWNADFKIFEEKILKEINNMLTNGKDGNNE